jgi:hypothetical protein
MGGSQNHSGQDTEEKNPYPYWELNTNYYARNDTVTEIFLPLWASDTDYIFIVIRRRI